MQAAAIILLCLVAAVGYGIVHDQVTARICVEYFTIGHAPVFGTDDPTLLGLGWGIRATWWAGLLLGLPLAAVARGGAAPKRTVRSLVRPLATLMANVALLALIAGLTGWLFARTGVVVLVGPIASQLPAERHVPYLADLWAHSASYLFGFAGGIILVVQVWRRRVYAELTVPDKQSISG